MSLGIILAVGKLGWLWVAMIPFLKTEFFQARTDQEWGCPHNHLLALQQLQDAAPHLQLHQAS